METIKNVVAPSHYAVKIDNDWKIFKAESLHDLVLQIADYTGNNTKLFQKAISSCFDTDAIEMYNVFAESYEIIQGIWKLDSHIWGDDEL